MPMERKNAPGRNHHPGAGGHDYRSFATRAGRKEEIASFCRLTRRTKCFRQEVFARNPGEIRHLGKMLNRYGLPLADRTRTLSDAYSKTAEAAAFGLQICGKLFHGDKLSGTEISVKLIYSAPLRRISSRFGGVWRP